MYHSNAAATGYQDKIYSTGKDILFLYGLFGYTDHLVRKKYRVPSCLAAYVSAY